ncbi:hypothetical protein GLS40_00645 [Pseudooceanicola sp. 216_PA32_1]|uniref:Glycolipid-binding n=1 Tax=Pseudooceanicola pacificus TaxID=2676438 RepID=A0A844W1E1_9RHOB|nr:putative glycolipid-binding domain-containing protein [Pseudooceanicola pacificus]MWB76524.1 hypothetical protein [Pseudooceanicola pacificus]
MTGATLATAHWRRLGGEGTDRCTLAQVDNGWILAGQALWREDEVDCRLTYAVRCDPDWRSLSADVTGRCGKTAVRLRIAASGDGWALNDVAQPGTEGLLDIDLGFTPATNLLPVQRLAGRGGVQQAPAAWLVPGLDRLDRLEQTYDRQGAGKVGYTAPSVGYEDILRLHPSGFVTFYPGLWEGWVDE